MKKLLLVSLLAMGATSFGAVSADKNTPDEVNVGITVKGRVFTPSGQLVVTPNDNITPDGRVMAFDLGDIAVNTTSKVMDGGFKIERLGAGIGAAAAPVQQALISTTQKLEASLAKTEQVIGGTEEAAKIATVKYALGFTNLDGANAGDAALKVATGNIGVSAEAGQVAGNIVDTNELRILVSNKTAE